MPWCDLHYDVDECAPECVVQIVRTELPDRVFVAICVYTKAVATNTVIATQPISGGPQSIFNRPRVTMEERLGVEILAVALTRPEAERAVEKHRADHPGFDADYEISEQTIGLNQTVQETVQAVTDHPCLLCQTPGLPLNRSFCDNCERRRNQALRERDLDLISGSQP